MSDSDDTDILLLIPPDYFITTAQEKLQQEERIERQQQQLQRRLNRMSSTMDAMDSEIATTTAAYRFLPPNKKAELNLINSRLQSIESMANDKDDERFTATSDISTISACTVRTQGKTNPSRTHNGLVHSTPKGRQRINEENAAHDDGVLSEIDNFLEDRQYFDSDWNHRNDDRYSNRVDEYRGSHAGLPSTLNRLSIEHAPHVQFESMAQQTMPSSRDQNLISLSELWSKSGQNTAIATGSTSISLQEEHLRRQHLEKTVHSLQSRLLEYQQRISVAMEVDRQKDNALRSTQASCKSLEDEISKLRNTIEKLEQHHRECNNQKDLLQKELAQAVSLATKFQEKNEKLEAEMIDSARKTNECSYLYKAQIEELEVKLHGCKRSEEIALNELSNSKDKLAKAEYQSEKLKIRCEELEKENSSVKHQKEMLHDFHQKLRARFDALETQKKSLQESVDHLTESELTMKRKLEMQQKTLKLHYQQQLENVVAQKLREFQEQLDKMEDSLKTEARERERLIAERAVKQLELINEKNELEHNLLQEKHNEEVELYRIQLANASKKIDDLEAKLSNYKSKRVDIAEKLHNVMETQWRKALEILTSPPSQFGSLGSNIGSDIDIDESPENNLATHKEREKSNELNGHENEYRFETPKSSKFQKSKHKQCNLNVLSEANAPTNDNKSSAPEPIDRLQAYIELLLSKSPSDVDKLHEILSLTKKNRISNGKSERTTKRNVGSHSKPPWKA